MKVTKSQLRRIIREEKQRLLESYDNIQSMNKAIMDAIFEEPLSEDMIMDIGINAAPGASSEEVLDFIDELMAQGTIEWNDDIQMYDLP